MFDFRRITSILTIAALVATGIIASTHTHFHAEKSGEASGIHAGSCSHSGHSCSHGHHDHGDQEHAVDSQESQNHDHDDCQVCKLLAAFSAPAIVPTAILFDSMATGFVAEIPVSFSVETLCLTTARGPPVFAV